MPIWKLPDFRCHSQPRLTGQTIHSIQKHVSGTSTASFSSFNYSVTKQGCCLKIKRLTMHRSQENSPGFVFHWLFWYSNYKDIYVYIFQNVHKFAKLHLCTDNANTTKQHLITFNDQTKNRRDITCPSEAEFWGIFFSGFAQKALSPCWTKLQLAITIA